MYPFKTKTSSKEIAKQEPIFFLKVKKHLDEGNNVNKPLDDIHNTLLHQAAVSGFTDTVSFLIKSGASVDSVTSDNDTPLCMAAHFGHSKIVSILLQNGANVNFLSNDGITPFLDVCIQGNIETLKIILNSKTNINQTNALGQNALIISMTHKNDNMVNCLLKGGINVDAMDLNRSTPLSYAAIFGSSVCVESLCKHGADVLSRDIGGNTPLHNAVKSGSLETIQILISNGAKLEMKNIEGETPLSVVITEHNNTLLDYFYEFIAKGSLKSLNRNGLCPCGSELKYKKCCLNSNYDEFLNKISSIRKPEYDSISSLIESQIKITDWTYKNKLKSSYTGLTPNYYLNYPWKSDIFITSMKGLSSFMNDGDILDIPDLNEPSNEIDIVVFKTIINLKVNPEFEESVAKMVMILNDLKLSPKTHTIYKNGDLSFMNITSRHDMLKMEVSLPDLISRNTAFFTRVIKPFNSLMASGPTLYTDWVTIVEEFSPSKNTNRLFKESFDFAFKAKA